MMDSNKIPLLSFFSGGGFMDMGFEEAGFTIAWTNEHDEVFAKFYAEGITNWKNNCGVTGQFQISNLRSIKDLSAVKIINQAFHSVVPNVFGIIGGPPCQDFSMNGNLTGFKGDKGSLTDSFLSKIIEINPSFFVMENVTGLLKVKKNAKHFLHLLEIMRNTFLIDFTILNSLDFGVPQFRERVFVIGINKQKFDLKNVMIGLDGKWFPFPKNEIYFNSAKKYIWPMPVAFGKSLIKNERIPLQLCLESCLVPKESEHAVANADEYFKLYGDKRILTGIKEGETNRPSFKRLHRYKYSPTACYGNNEVHLHPYQHRRLSVRETLRIQGVPDCYVLSRGLLSKKFKMIGNGVPVPLAKAVASSLINFLQKLPLINRDGHLVKKEKK